MGKFKVSGFLTSIQNKRKTRTPKAPGKTTVVRASAPKGTDLPAILAGVLAALALGGGSFWTFVRLFGLRYTRDNWHSGSVTGGLVKTWNDIAAAFGRSTYTILTQYGDAGQSSGLFLTIVLVLLILLAALIVMSGNLWFSLLYLLPIVILSICFHLYPGFTGVILIAGAFALMVIRRAHGGRLRISSIALVVLICAVSWGLSWQPVTQSALDRPGSVRKAAESAAEKVQTLRYGENPLDDGEMASSPKARKSKKTALRVTMEEPDSIYLRGYVGEYFDGSQWNVMNTPIHYDSRPLMEGLRLSGLHPLSQLTLSAALGETVTEDTQQEMTLETVGASTKYAYVPYEIADGSVKGASSWSDAFLTGKGLRGLDSYTCMISENLTGLWTDIAGALYSHEFTEELQFYQMSESSLNVWIYDHYTELDDDTAEMLAEEIGTRGNQEKGHVEYKKAIEQIYTYFSENIVLSNSAKAGDEPLQTLFENYSGNDEMCATAATEMFRYYGIPARYVEGYLITMDDVDLMEPEEPYNIPFRNAHAWTEIYVDGVGWIPIEVCMEYQDLMPQADMETGLESASNSNPFYQSERSGSNVITKQENEEASPLPWKRILLIACLILFLLLAALLLWKFGPKLLKAWHRRKDFRHPDPKKAVTSMYGYALVEALPISDNAARIGSEAAYSVHRMEEQDRLVMLAELKNARRIRSAEKRQKLKDKFSRIKLPRINRTGNTSTIGAPPGKLSKIRFPGGKRRAERKNEANLEMFKKG